MLRKTSWLFIALLMVGCTMQTQPPRSDQSHEPQPYNFEHPPVRLSERVTPGARIGAAYSESDLTHVLLLGRPGVAAGDLRSHHVARSTYQMIREQVSTLEQTGPINSAWVRYCDGGLGMTDGDWQYVMAHGAPQNIPASLASGCDYPK